MWTSSPFIQVGKLLFRFRWQYQTLWRPLTDGATIPDLLDGDGDPSRRIRWARPGGGRKASRCNDRVSSRVPVRSARWGFGEDAQRFFRMSRCSRRWRFSRRASSSWDWRSETTGFPPPAVAPRRRSPPSSVGGQELAPSEEHSFAETQFLGDDSRRRASTGPRSFEREDSSYRPLPTWVGKTSPVQRAGVSLSAQALMAACGVVVPGPRISAETVATGMGQSRPSDPIYFTLESSTSSRPCPRWSGVQRYLADASVSSGGRSKRAMGWCGA